MEDERLCWMSATRMLREFAQGNLSPVEVASALLQRIQRLDPEGETFRVVDPDTTGELARQAEVRLQELERGGHLDGVPVAIKDSFYTRGWSTLYGSKMVDPDQSWGRDAPSVSALKRHNAVLVGKTTMPEFGWKGVNDSPLTGITRNPWDRTKTPGGSSGGNGAALASGMTPLALGSDIGGSVRIPASFCNVVGLKPTQHIAPVRRDAKTGLLLHAGVMARTVEDIALAMDVIAEWHPNRPGRPHRPRRGTGYRDALGEDVEGLRIALAPGLGFAEVASEVEDAVREAARTLDALDAWVTEVDPGIDDPTDLYRRLLVPTLAHSVDEVPAPRREHIDPGLAEIAEQGRAMAAVDHVGAMQERRALIGKVGRLQHHYDILLTATVPVLPFEAGREVPPDWPHRRWWTWTPLTFPFNVTGQPAISVPCAFSREGLPIGVQFVGPRHREDLVLKVAHAYQRANPLFDRRPASLSGTHAD
jgi:aspartyl-tRNA(Asn)/glutamyl-tRNA(Gln) amidotransferase subunit A